jgi:hypothetical protein
LPFELAEPDSVLGVGDERSSTAQTRVRQLVSPGKRPITFGAAFDLGERALEQIRASPSAAVSGRVAQVDDERVEVVG